MESQKEPSETSATVAAVKVQPMGDEGDKGFKIEPVFYSDSFEALPYFWQNMPPDPDEEYFRTTVRRREQELNIITGQLSKKVMDNYDAFVKAMENIQVLSEELRFSKEICREGRSGINNAKTNLSESALNTILLHERKENYLKIAQELEKIKTIMTTKKLLLEKINSDSFLEALTLYTQCSNYIVSSSQYEAVKKMDISAENKIIRKKLDEALAEACRFPFDAENFRKTVEAYHSILKVSKIVAAINKHFAGIIDRTVKDALAHAVKGGQAEEGVSISHLVKRLAEKDFVPVFKAITCAMVDIMLVHNQIKTWSKEAGSFFSEISSGVEQQRKVVWDEMQRRLSLLCNPKKLSSFKIESFLNLLDELNTFIEIGEDFGGGESAHKLRASIKQLSKSYFEDFHQLRIDALKKCIDNENFEKFNTKSKIRLKDIKEISQYLSESSISLKTLGIAGHTFSDVLRNGNPFKVNQTRTKQSSTKVVHSEMYDEDEVLSREVVEAQDKRNPTTVMVEELIESDDGPTITFSTLTLVKFIGEYTGMMKSLSNVSWDVCQGMIEVIHWYLFSSYTFFGPSMNIPGIRISSTLRTNILGMQAKFLKIGGDPKSPSRPPLKMNEKIAMNNNNLFGLQQRVVCAESLLFLMDALYKLKPSLQKLLPKQNNHQLNQFYQSSVETLTELREIIYKELCHRLVPADTLVTKVQNVDWNTNDIPMTHSPYIDLISASLEGFKNRFQNLQKSTNPPLSKDTIQTIWSMMISHIFDCLLEGYATPQCTAEGRAMMGIDYRNLIDKINQLLPNTFTTANLVKNETNHGLIVFPKRLEEYIKGYYEQEADLEGWLKKHLNDYTNKQLKALVESGSWNLNIKRICLKLLQTPNK